tara:strand:+ start:2968 stop:4857 length:1890 start_codon:yes stop_codon:yes gene_type:complete
MRRNLFLHFLNRDTREIFGVYELLDRGRHANILREPLNAAAILCENACYAPPGFVIEDDIAFELFEAQSAYLETGLVQLPIRERNLADYAEKKRGEYAPARNRYSGLFDDSRLEALSSYGTAITRRNVKIGPAIVKGFESGADSRAAVWKGIRNTAAPEVIQNLRETPAMLLDSGKALTWSIMQPHLIATGKPQQKDMRDVLQNIYFGEYCREYKLILVSDIPYMPEVFYLPAQRAVYNFKRFKTFLNAFAAANMLLQASAAFIVRIRAEPGFIELIDAYAELALVSASDTDLQYHTARAVGKVSFDWAQLAERRSGSFADPTEIETLEIGDACAELASVLSMEHGLARRADNKDQTHKTSGREKPKMKIITKDKKLKVSIFVALEEELKVLTKQLNLTKKASPAATGEIDGVEIVVLCPRAMGRVASAVEMMRYLGAEGTKPDLILCIGLAGGFKEAKIDPGTVICAETVVDLANRKVSDDEAGAAVSKFRRLDFDCTKAFYTIATSDEFDVPSWEKHCRENFDWPEGRVPSLREGKIASVDEVVASDDHRQKMIENVEKLLGVEMEAGGICAAAKSFHIPVAVLRVVSDMADPSKADDNWRSLGMKTLAELIARMPLKRVIEIAKGN